MSDLTRKPERLTDRVYDVVIIGGGIYGLTTAWDAALRGMSVLVLEQADFAHATSSAHYKLVHGGLRYLQHLDLKRMRISIRERRWMMQAAPHLVSPVEFVIPCYGHGMKGAEVLRAAFLLNDLIGWDRNRGIEAGRRIPRGRLLSKTECLRRVPGFRAEGLKAGAVYADAQVYSSERFAMAIARSAAEAGAVLINNAEVVGAILEETKVTGLRVRDRARGETVTVQGKLVVNMTGPWSEITRALIRDPNPPREVIRSKGVQFFTRPLADCGFTVETRQKDRSAKIARGGRSLFVQPWRGCSFIGQSDKLYKGPPGDFAVTEADLQAFLAEFNEAYPAAALKREDVIHVLGGMVPVGSDDPNPDAANISHRYEILDHATADGLQNFISVIGVKFTICRQIAEQVVDLCQRKLGTPVTPCPTRTAKVWGGQLPNVAEAVTALASRTGLPPPAAAHLVHLYGDKAETVLEVGGDPTPLPGRGETLAAEIRHAVLQEAPRNLADVVLRRTDLGTLGHPGHEALKTAAGLMGDLCGWDATRQTAEIAAVDALYLLK